jgi:hypothetical protein
MSHFSINRIKLRNPNATLLRQVVEQVAKQLGGEVVREIQDYYGRVRRDFLIGIRTPQIPCGIGVKISPSGEVEIVGDRWGVEDKVWEFEQLLVQTYTTQALALVLRGQGYQVAVQKQQEKMVIHAYA